MPRVVWKGAISFGLVNIPVSLYSGARTRELDLDMLDKRDMAPIGYQRVNKKTGRPVAWEDIVKGYEYQDDRYVVLSDEDFEQANPKATQTVDIVAFVEADRIAPYFFDKPYYLEPGKRAEKGYALLRETLARTRRIGIAKVVIRTRQYLAALMPVGSLLVLNTLRFADEIVDADELALPAKSAGRAGVSERELAMAERLVEDMSEEWNPEQYHDTYREDLLARIEQKVRTKETHVVTAPRESPAPARGAQVIDLMAMLKKSLETRDGASAGESRGSARHSARRDATGAGSEAARSQRGSRRRARVARKVVTRDEGAPADEQSHGRTRRGASSHARRAR